MPRAQRSRKLFDNWLDSNLCMQGWDSNNRCINPATKTDGIFIWCNEHAGLHDKDIFQPHKKNKLLEVMFSPELTTKAAQKEINLSREEYYHNNRMV